MSLLRKLLMENSIKPSVIIYTTTDGNIVNPYNNMFFDARRNQVKVVSNTYNDGFGKITFGGVVTSIGDSAFRECSGLTSIEIPSGVTSIGDRAFSNCNGLTSIEIPSGVTSIGDSAFYRCDGLTSIEIPSGVTSIGDSAFSYCSGLTSINIPSGVTSIGGQAFYDCSGLTSIEILATAPPKLGSNAFTYICSSAKIYVPSESVDAYKTAANWSTYASKIQAIGS